MTPAEIEALCARLHETSRINGPGLWGEAAAALEEMGRENEKAMRLNGDMLQAQYRTEQRIAALEADNATMTKELGIIANLVNHGASSRCVYQTVQDRMAECERWAQENARLTQRLAEAENAIETLNNADTENARLREALVHLRSYPQDLRAQLMADAALQEKS